MVSQRTASPGWFLHPGGKAGRTWNFADLDDGACSGGGDDCKEEDDIDVNYADTDDFVGDDELIDLPNMAMLMMGMTGKMMVMRRSLTFLVTTSSQISSRLGWGEASASKGSLKVNDQVHIF